jgi:two-component system, NarL family, nitrate/nitrite response regulator NarL
VNDAPIVIVDPDVGWQCGLLTVVQRLGVDVHVAGTADELRSGMGGRVPSLVILEVDLPDANGYELCRELHDAYGDDLPVIFVSGRRTDPCDRVAGLLVGADDYVVKPFDPDEFLARVRRSLRRAGRSREVMPAGGFPRVELTPREQEVLSLLVGGLTQQQIAAELVISPKTVGTHLQRILGKLGAHSRAQAVGMALREGLVAATLTGGRG